MLHCVNLLKQLFKKNHVSDNEIAPILDKHLSKRSECFYIELACTYLQSFIQLSVMELLVDGVWIDLL